MVKPNLGVFIGLSAVEVPILDLIVRRVMPWDPARRSLAADRAIMPHAQEG